MANALNVLLVEDSETDAKLVAHELRKGLATLETQRVDDLVGMKRALSDKRWDVVISDWAMPKLSVFEALAATKDSDLDLPFIIVSGSTNEEDAIDAMRAGANDYVLKYKLGRLAPAVEREVRDSKARRARHATEADLSKSLARFNRLYESGIVGIIVTDVQGNVHEANDAYLRMLGYSREEFLAGKIDWAASTPPEWRVADEAAAQLLKSAGVDAPRLSREKELFRKDGSRVAVLIGGAVLEYPECIAMVTDISALKRSEKALAGSLVRFNRLSESGIVGILVADRSGKVLEPNDAFLKMVGYTRQEFLSAGLSLDIMTPPEWRKADEVAAQMIRSSGVDPPREKELFRKDGSRVDVLLAGAALEYPECIKLVADISRRKKIEKALAASQEQFRQAQKMEAVGRLAGGVAHDFNNLLSVILTYTEMGIRGLPSGEPLREDLLEVKAAGERAATLTKQLLALSRQQVLDPKVVDLNHLVDGTSKMLGRMIGEDIKLTFQPGPDLGAVLADPGRSIRS